MREISAVSPPGLSANALRPRLAFLDWLRGLAIVAMVVFHLMWDAYYFGFSAIDVTAEPGWVAFQKSIVTAFLLLVGAGLALGHGDGIRWRRFWKRFAFIAAAAVLTTIGTYVALPEYFVYFGILHAIAAFSLLGLAFLRLDGWLTLLLGVAVVAAAFLVPAHPAMMAREWSWIGFWPYPPPTTDIVPVFPWFGVVLVGIGGTQRLRRTALWPRLAALRLADPVSRLLRFLGRWSLLIYVLHQPLIYGGMSLIPRAAAPDEIGFVRQCETVCQNNGNEPGFCGSYCSCALEQVNGQDLWPALATPTPDPRQSQAIESMKRLCEAMSRPALELPAQ